MLPARIAIPVELMPFTQLTTIITGDGACCCATANHPLSMQVPEHRCESFCVAKY